MRDSHAGVLLRMLITTGLNLCVCAAVAACMLDWVAYGTASTVVTVALVCAWFVTPTWAQVQETCAYLKALQTSD